MPVHWARRVWALPFLTTLCPSARYAPYVAKGRRHKSLVERARGLIGQAGRWLPGRALVVVADSSYAAVELLAWCQRLPAAVTLITRLRLNAALLSEAIDRTGVANPNWNAASTGFYYTRLRKPTPGQSSNDKYLGSMAFFH